MLSYRHAFHAGNHADVLKHFVQVQLHLYMNQKDAAYTYIDTHSGAGVYALDSAQATRSGEYETGIGPLWSCTDVPAPLAAYLDLVKGMNPSGKMRYYPGSPYVAEQVAREQDRLRLFELHPSDHRILSENFRRLLDSGVKFVSGNDAGMTFTGFDDFQLDLEMLVEYVGMSNAEAIVTATAMATVRMMMSKFCARNSSA